MSDRLYSETETEIEVLMSEESDTTYMDRYNLCSKINLSKIPKEDD